MQTLRFGKQFFTFTRKCIDTECAHCAKCGECFDFSSASDRIERDRMSRELRTDEWIGDRVLRERVRENRCEFRLFTRQ